jgi:hypothetical protein
MKTDQSKREFVSRKPAPRFMFAAVLYPPGGK